MNSNATATAHKIASTLDVIEHPKFVDSPFYNLTRMHTVPKGKAFEVMVEQILRDSGLSVKDSTNKSHDYRVQFEGEKHHTKIEIKGAMVRRDADTFATGQFALAQDWDELFIFLVFPFEVQGWRVNRSIIKGMIENGVICNAKSDHGFMGLTPEVLDGYDCTRVF